MKMPKAKQLPSGSWNCQVRIDGRAYSFTRETKKDAMQDAMAFKMGYTAEPSDLTLTMAIDRYIADRESILSPSTIAGYRVIQRNRFQELMKTKINKIDANRWQRSVNLQARTVSAKTLHSSAMFVQSVISQYAGVKLSARLPQIVKKELPWIQPAELPAFLEEIYGSKYEAPILLGLMGLRQSEILSVRYSDVDIEKNTIRVSGASVKNERGELVEKEENKNQSSNRIIPIMISRFADIVKESEYFGTDEYIYHKYSNVLRLNINKACTNIGIDEVGVHGLRRSFASLMYYLGVPELEAMALGGWNDYKTMRSTYTKLADAERIKSEQKITEFFGNNSVTKNKSYENHTQFKKII